MILQKVKEEVEMIHKILLGLLFFNFLNQVMANELLYKSYEDKKGKHTIYLEEETVTNVDKKKIKRITKIFSTLNNSIEWNLTDKYWLSKEVSSYSVIDDFDNDGTKDIILLYGIDTSGTFSGSNVEHYIDFELAVIYKNKIAKIMHTSDADDCYRYTEVDKVFYTFPKVVIKKIEDMLSLLREKHGIQIPDDFRKQIKREEKYILDDSCREDKPWQDNMYGYRDTDGKRKVVLYKNKVGQDVSVDIGLIGKVIYYGI